MIPAMQFQDRFTFYRDMESDKFDIQYRGSNPFFDNGELTQKWKINVDKGNNKCKFCTNYQ